MALSMVSINELIPVIKEKLQMGGEVTLKIKGTSMRPFFKSDVTCVDLIKFDGSLNRFDIVLYEALDKTYVMHRYIGMKNDKLLICGDALTKEELIHQEQIIAKVIAFSENGKSTIITNKRYRRNVKFWVKMKPFRRVLLFFAGRIWGR